ncbi:hypothetical protein [Geodermatophilus sabuli]|uniref:Uncharacterized protein n=1 Tax=Geodermatophilus sabuli TaxID=1564158 RepID=A0A285EF32_9ACTN|nr:hypothetical protein [Geodermatophilus sabuli]MBB3086683.1 hypothetical protein [Geodermatophilus sabuli]SNX97665.1 hypothetical protein SAMN06893097_10830 [Geodermatophilus sabuli]
MDLPHWPRPAGAGPVVALGKLVADQVLVLSAPLVAGGQQRVARTTTAGGAPANVTANLVRPDVPARLAGWNRVTSAASGWPARPSSTWTATTCCASRTRWPPELPWRTTPGYR